MNEPDPVLVVDLFPELNKRLLELLDSLSDEEWQAPTVCEGWSIKDLALHLLADEIGNIARRRDAFFDSAALREGEDLSRWPDLVGFINRYNEAWVQATRRISPRLLRDLLAATSNDLHRYFVSLEPFAIGGPVNWAGPAPAPVWLDIAREYTERWLHQQQIRDAAGRPGLTEPRFLSPVLATFARALPHTYRDIDASEGTQIMLTITGESGGTWRVVRARDRWLLTVEAAGHPDAKVTMGQDIAWRLFTKGVSRQQALGQVTLEGDEALAVKLLDAVAIIA
ncbi:MAG: maleylpyruvate isomerase family mycothiol-dependent enzyme [Dehalococcoidia bacterium]